MKRNVIKNDLLPARSPLLFLAVLWLILDRVGISSFWMGFYWGFFALILVIWIALLANQKQCNLSDLP